MLKTLALELVPASLTGPELILGVASAVSNREYAPHVDKNFANVSSLRIVAAISISSSGFSARRSRKVDTRAGKSVGS
jgi:hypothetical protein